MKPYGSQKASDLQNIKTDSTMSTDIINDK